jgi:hypothetical protein
LGSDVINSVFRLKSALMALGLKCGGTLQERAERYLTSVLIVKR